VQAFFATRRLEKYLGKSSTDQQSSNQHQHINMGSLFEQPRNAGTLCKEKSEQMYDFTADIK